MYVVILAVFGCSYSSFCENIVNITARLNLVGEIKQKFLMSPVPKS